MDNSSRTDLSAHVVSTTATELQSLLDRVLAATGPDRKLDCDLAATFGWVCRKTERFDQWAPPKGFRLPLGTLANPPFFTASLDAALALVARVLPGWEFFMEVEHPTNGPTIWWVGMGDPLHAWMEEAPTAALALVAALLKALIAQREPTTPLNADHSSREEQP